MRSTPFFPQRLFIQFTCTHQLITNKTGSLLHHSEQKGIAVAVAVAVAVVVTVVAALAYSPATLNLALLLHSGADSTRGENIYLIV